jgi:predicted aldo/keto reductase-like oxidoreductase
MSSDDAPLRPALGRRDFLVGAALAGLAGALPRAADADPDDPPRVRRKVPLGKTGLEISDVSFGSSRLRDEEDLVRHAFDRGINYFDTAESYTGGVSETTIGKALQGKRDHVILASKVETTADTRRDTIMSALEGSLRRLRTDHVDVYFNHAVNDVGRLKNPEWHAFVADAKQQGKIRFVGMSGHAGRLVECLDHALDTRQVDVVLVAYNFGQDPAFYEKLLKDFDSIRVQPDLPRVLARAKAAGVGVVAMKTLMGARLNDMRPYETPNGTFAQAAFRWVLSRPDVDALIVSMTSPAQVDEYLGASGATRMRRADAALLGRYAALQAGAYCQHGCSACEASCPNGVPIAEVLRTRMYAVDYGDLALGRAEYGALGVAASACVACTAEPCAGACPHGLSVGRMTSEAHRLLVRPEGTAGLPDSETEGCAARPRRVKGTLPIVCA